MQAPDGRQSCLQLQFHIQFTCWKGHIRICGLCLSCKCPLIERHCCGVQAAGAREQNASDTTGATLQRDQLLQQRLRATIGELSPFADLSSRAEEPGENRGLDLEAARSAVSPSGKSTKSDTTWRPPKPPRQASGSARDLAKLSMQSQ